LPEDVDVLFWTRNASSLPHLKELERKAIDTFSLYVDGNPRPSICALLNKRWDIQFSTA
jgi:hypothetical protein